MTHVTCRLTAKNRDQLRNPTLDDRVWPTFTFLWQAKHVNLFETQSTFVQVYMQLASLMDNPAYRDEYLLRVALIEALGHATARRVGPSPLAETVRVYARCTCSWHR